MKPFEKGGPINPNPETIIPPNILKGQSRRWGNLKSLREEIADARARNDNVFVFPDDVKPEELKGAKFHPLP